MIRAVRYSDLDAVREIYVSAFREEYGRRGVDIGVQVARWKRMYPLLRTLATFPNPYRHMLNLHVLEEAGRLCGFIMTSPGNDDATRWHIDHVAVAPDCQGRGIGKRLVEFVFERYAVAGVRCFTLEVDALNAPALGLYQKLGFRRYADITYMRMAAPPAPQGLDVPGLRPFAPRDAQGLYELYLASTPAPVRIVDAKKPDDFGMSLVSRGMATLRRGMNHLADLRFVVEEKGQVVGYLRVAAQLRALPHTVQLMVHPGYQHLYGLLLDKAAQLLTGYPAQPVLAWAPDYQPAKVEALAAWGLKTLTVDRCLVRDNLIALKLPNQALVPGEEKAFKPAFTNLPCLL